MSVPVVMRGKEGEEASWWGSGKVGGVVDLVLLSVPLISHVDRCTPSHLEECALDSHLPLEVSFY